MLKNWVWCILCIIFCRSAAECDLCCSICFHQTVSYWCVMQRKVASGNQAKYCTPPKTGLATFYGIGYISFNFIIVIIYFTTFDFVVFLSDMYGLIFLLQCYALEEVFCCLWHCVSLPDVWFCVWHTSTEEIRKSIETLDRILDEYDSGVGSKELQTEKRFIPQKADAAAHMLASCMQAAGNHKLRKRSGNCQHFVGLSLESTASWVYNIVGYFKEG